MGDELKQELKNSIENMWEHRFTMLETKIGKILDELEDLKTKITIIDDKILTNEESMIQQPITETYIDTILKKIAYLKDVILSKSKNNTFNFFSPALILTESIEKQIIEKQQVSEKQLNELNKIYAREIKK